MAPLVMDCSSWEEAIKMAEWYCLEIVMDDDDGLGLWVSDARRALRVLNRIQAQGAVPLIVRTLKSSFPRPVPKALRLESFCRLMEEVDHAYTFFAEVAITQAERRRKSKAIANAARVLAAEIAHPATRRDLRLGWALWIKDGVRLSPRLNSPHNYEAIALIAERMVELPKVVGNPNSKTAHRLYFLREMTNVCVSYYRQPKRSLVLALASLYFDVSDLTTNDLAKYAPVKKPRLQSRFSSPPNRH